MLALGVTWVCIGRGRGPGAGLGPPWAAAVARRVPRDVDPFNANTVSMAVGTTVIRIGLGPLPGFHR